MLEKGLELTHVCPLECNDVHSPRIGNVPRCREVIGQLDSTLVTTPTRVHCHSTPGR